jgi:predicted ATPase/DNA-binding SARP family transcriptional activator
MDFRILGPLDVAADRAVRLGSLRQRTVLALLLIRPDEAVSTDRLVEELWGEDPPQTARHTLQTHVHQLRKGLGLDAGRLETRPPGYRLRLLPDELDALIFQDLTERGRRALTVGEPRTAASLLRQALGLWRGPPLADLPDVTALEPERARLNGMRLAALEDRIEADLALGRHAGLVEELEALAAGHPYRERLWGQLMVALYRSGRQAEALAAYRRVRETLAEELGLDPGPDLARLQEQILIQDPVLQGPAPRPAVEVSQNLPVQRTSFVGRRRELAELQGLLQARRLVTVTGPPGVGKTRLALGVAARSLEAFPHGVFVVSLAEIEDPDLVPSAIAAALGVVAGNRAVVEALLDHAKPKRLLIVFDNFEHLLAGVRIVGELLDAAPGIRVLATSRARLRLSGEQEYPLGPLPIPQTDDPDLPGSDALVLFEDRARAVDPHFALTVDNAPLAAEVVRRLDGLPLAIELAAARLRLFPLGELQGRLERVLPLLTGGPVDRSARQRTLRDAIAWSYDLLDPAQQALFRRLGVFRGGFTLEAAEAVAGGDPVQDVLAGVSALVEGSLLRQPAEAGPVRYSMLETIHEYALDQLRASGEEQQTAHRHADFYAHLVAQAEPELTRAKQAEWLGRLTAEHANLVAVLRWARQTGNSDLGLVLAATLWRFWSLRGHFAEGRQWLEDLLATAGQAPTIPRVKGLIALAGLAYWQGDPDCAETRYREAVAAVEGLDDWWLRFEALAGLVSTIACYRGDPTEAAALERQFQALAAQRPEDPLAAGFGMAIAGTVRLFLGDLEGSRRYNEPLLAACRAIGERFYEGDTLRMLGLTSLLQRRYGQAEEEFRSALDIAWQARDLASMQYDLDRLGQAAVALGQADRGVTLAGAASRLRETAGGGLTVHHLRWELEHPRDAARRALTEPEIDIAWAQGRVMTPEEAVAYARAVPTPNSAPS